MFENLIFVNWLLSAGFIPFSSLEIGENTMFRYDNSFVQTVNVEFNIGKYANVFTTIDIFETKADSIYFDPYRANFVIGLEARYNGFELGITHECNHDIVTGWDFNEYNGLDGAWMNIYFGWSDEYQIKNPISIQPQLYLGYRPYDDLYIKQAADDINDYFRKNIFRGKYNNTVYGRIGCVVNIYNCVNIDLMIQPEYSLIGYGWDSIKGKIGAVGYYKNIGLGIDWTTQMRLHKNGYGTNKITISVIFKGGDYLF